MVNAIGNPNNNVQSVRQRTIKDGRTGLAIGAVLGAAEGYARKSWIKGDQPSDKFIKSVSQGLTKALEPEEHEELEKINDFFEALVEPKTDVNSLRTKIEASTDLMNAVPKNEGETTKDALDRIFSNPDKNEVKSKLQLMQDRTSIDKKVDKYGAKKLILSNLNTEKKVLEKADSTSDEMFKVLTKAAKKVKLKTAAAHTVVGGVLLGITGLLIGATKPKS